MTSGIFRNLRCGLAAFIFIAATTACCPAASPPTEAEIKAVFLFHLTQFITWPEPSTNKAPDFVIGVLGQDPFKGALDFVVLNEKVNGRPIRVLRSNRASDLSDCPLVYVSPQHREPLQRVINELRNSLTLPVGEDDDFLRAGGIVRFRTVDRKIRLQIHLGRAQSRGFRISAQLLRVSDVIDDERR